MNQRGFDPRLVSGDTKNKIYSFDLSNATDRFPIGFQSEVLKYLTNESYSNVWKSLMIDYPFSIPWKPNSEVYYKSGQPMGAYTSWAIFALCHHLVIRVAAHNVLKTFDFNTYLL
jgi:hypothetical protein